MIWGRCVFHTAFLLVIVDIVVVLLSFVIREDRMLARSSSRCSFLAKGYSIDEALYLGLFKKQ